jgi:hypothetical protein
MSRDGKLTLTYPTRWYMILEPIGQKSDCKSMSWAVIHFFYDPSFQELDAIIRR